MDQPYKRRKVPVSVRYYIIIPHPAKDLLLHQAQTDLPICPIETNTFRLRYYHCHRDKPSRVTIAVTIKSHHVNLCIDIVKRT